MLTYIIVSTILGDWNMTSTSWFIATLVIMPLHFNYDIKNDSIFYYLISGLIIGVIYGWHTYNDSTLYWIMLGYKLNVCTS